MYFWLRFSFCSMSCCSLVAKFNPRTHQPCMIAIQPPQLTSRHATRLSQHANTIQALPYTIHTQISTTSCLVSAMVFHRSAAAANTTTATVLRCSPNPILTLSYLPAAWLTAAKLYNSFLTSLGGTQCLYIQRIAVSTTVISRFTAQCSFAPGCTT